MDNLEKSVLHAITVHKRLALDFASSSNEQLLLTPESRVLGRTFSNYIKTFKDIPTKRVLLDKHSEEPDLINLIREFYDSIEDKNYNEAEYAYDVSKLKQVYGERRLEAIKEKVNYATNDVTGTIKEIEKEISLIKSANGQRAYERKTIKNHTDDFRNNYIEKLKNPDLGRGILTGYSFFDYIKNGLRPADLIIIAGETGSGKSMFLNNIAIQIYMQNNRIDMTPDQFGKGYNVAYFSLEMPYEDCFRRTISRMADVPEYAIRDAKLGKAEAKGVSQACKFMKNYPYEFEIIDVPRGFSVEQLELTFEDIKSDYTPDAIFIDYLGLMEDVDNDNDDWLKLGQLTGKIHEFGRVHAVPVLSAVQLNRIDPTNRKSDIKAIGLHRIGRSSLIATHATAIIQIETRQDEETHDDFIYHIIKHRGGESNKSHSILKNFSKCSITDKLYNVEAATAWSPGEDLSNDVANILGTR